MNREIRDLMVNSMHAYMHTYEVTSTVLYAIQTSVYVFMAHKHKAIYIYIYI
jgi:hypothetical protein